MTVTIRLSENEAKALRELAAIEGRTMQDVAHEAIVKHIRAAIVVKSAARGAARYADVLRRLSSADM